MFKKRENPLDAKQPKEKPVASPCVSICSLDEDDVCIGCHRSADEILAWGKMDNAQRRETIAKSEQRARDAGAYF
jgi:predicted Fe-S protein YdhL (DUF1289 family)